MHVLHRALLVAPLFLTACGDDWDYSGQDLGIALPMDTVHAAPDEEIGPEGMILMMVDTLRADHLGCYGSDAELTPNLDRLATRSHKFLQTISTSSWTRSAVASMFTGRHPLALNVLTQEDVLSSEVTTLAEALREDGWRTYAVCTNGNTSATWGFDQGFDGFEQPEGTVGYPDDFAMVPAQVVTERGLAYLETLEADDRFFLFLLYTDPHDPYLPHEDLYPMPETGGRFDGSRKALRLLDQLPEGERTKADEERIRHLYAGEVRYVDHWIGEFFEGVEALGLPDPLIVMTSDHGEGLWDHGLRAHGRDLHEECVHVPFLLHLPNQESGLEIPFPVSLVDLAPTLLGRAGLPAPDAMEGRDLKPLWDGEGRGVDFKFLYSELVLTHYDTHAVWAGKRKLIRDRSEDAEQEFQLFDLEKDPGETKNLYGDDEVAEAQEELRQGLWVWYDALMTDQMPLVRKSLETVDQAVIDNMRGMGYLGDEEDED